MVNYRATSHAHIFEFTHIQPHLFLFPLSAKAQNLNSSGIGPNGDDSASPLVLCVFAHVAFWCDFRANKNGHFGP